MTVWHNHTFKDDETPIFGFKDRVRFGDGVFDTMLVIYGEPAHGERHFKKLLKSADLMGFEVDYEISDLMKAARDTVKESRLDEDRAGLNVLISRGPAEHGLAIPDTAEVQLAMRAFPVPKIFPEVEAVFARTVRRNEGSPLSRFKTFNYGDNIMALREAKKRGANEAILLNNAGNVATSTVATIVVAYGGKVYTPPLIDGAQEGVTRGLLIERYGVIEKSMKEDELAASDGVFLSNSLRGLVPVVTLDGASMPLPDLDIDNNFHLV